ncbi:inositol monophosphatase family protein [Micrococcus luteus]|uniref:inositol monophosphatase family protein n=1 Tax=Micrococcus luteus TaxID=1270 RepID=UPI003018CD61
MARDLLSVPSPAALRRLAVDAAAARVPALRAAFRAGPSFPTTAAHPSLKTNHHDLVTEYDRSTEAALVRALTEAVPGSRVLGEETGAHGDPDHPLRWIVDPIDGTSNFTHGFAMFSVSIAAELDGELVAGAIADPAAGQVFSSDDTGAWLADLDVDRAAAAPALPSPDHPGEASRAPEAGAVVVKDERPLAEVSRPAPDPALGERGLNLVTSYPAGEALALEGSAALERFGELVRAHATVRRTVSGALELAYTAAGWADAALYVDTKPWDVAAGVHLLRAAGGTWIGGDHTAPIALALAPDRTAPTALRVLDDIIQTRLTAGT